LAHALRAAGRDADAARALSTADQAAVALTRRRPVESAIARAQCLAAREQGTEAVHLLERLLLDAPPGFAGWALPIDPLFRSLHGLKTFTNVVERLAERAR
jgi:hypothetical protein